MASNWGDDIDESMPKGRLKACFVINVRTMAHFLEQIDEETREHDNKYPKSEILKIWGSVMACFAVFLACSFINPIFAFVMMPFELFYGFILFKAAKVWKRFEYSRLQYWLMTIGALALMAAILFPIIQLLKA